MFGIHLFGRGLRNMASANGPNDGTRALTHSVLYPEVLKALESWLLGAPDVGTLIGGIALSHYVKPRLTQDADFLFLGASGIPERVHGFKRTRPGAFQHNRTGVEIEVLTPQSINMPERLAIWIIRHAVVDSSIGHKVRIASPSGIVAGKLGRIIRKVAASTQDTADVEQLLTHCHVDVSTAPLSEAELEAFAEIRDGVEARGELHR